MMPPIEMAPTIPVSPVVPVTFRITVAKRRVAIVIPDTGLLEDPISPTIREDTVAKKNPNTTMIRAPTRLTGKIGRIQIRTAITRITPISNGNGRSCSVRSCFPDPAFFFILPMACLNVLTIRGRLLIRLMIPPVATAPAPMYLM